MIPCRLSIHFVLVLMDSFLPILPDWRRINIQAEGTVWVKAQKFSWGSGGADLVVKVWAWCEEKARGKCDPHGDRPESLCDWLLLPWTRRRNGRKETKFSLGQFGFENYPTEPQRLLTTVSMLVSAITRNLAGPWGHWLCALRLPSVPQKAPKIVCSINEEINES